MTLEDLDNELERLRLLRESLKDDEEELEQRLKEFKRVNMNLIMNIDVKKGNIRLSEQKIKNIATDIHERVKFYMNLGTIPISLTFYAEETPETETVESEYEVPSKADSVSWLRKLIGR